MKDILEGMAYAFLVFIAIFRSYGHKFQLVMFPLDIAACRLLVLSLLWPELSALIRILCGDSAFRGPNTHSSLHCGTLSVITQSF